MGYEEQETWLIWRLYFLVNFSKKRSINIKTAICHLSHKQPTSDNLASATRCGQYGSVLCWVYMIYNTIVIHCMSGYIVYGMYSGNSIEKTINQPDGNVCFWLILWMKYLTNQGTSSHWCKEAWRPVQQ